jgi:hypothetical protein
MYRLMPSTSRTPGLTSASCALLAVALPCSQMHPSAVAFEELLRKEGLVTHHRYAVQVSAFITWMEQRQKTAFSAATVTQEDVLVYAGFVQKQRPLSGTLEIATMLRRFFRYQQQCGTITDSPMDGLRTSLLSQGRPQLLGNGRTNLQDETGSASETAPVDRMASARSRYPLLEQVTTEGFRRRGRPPGASKGERRATATSRAKHK